MSAAFFRRRTLSRPVLFLAPAALLAAVALVLPSCENFSVFGYTTRPNYRTDIHSVRVPLFKSNLILDSTRRGLEMDLTQAVIRRIQVRTPWCKVNTGNEDTELTGTIVSLTKNILNRDQQNLPRETETDMAVEVVWRDLRTGEILSLPKRGPGAPPPPPPDLPPGAPAPPPPGTAVFSIGQLIPEIGQSNATAYKQNIDRLAEQIVSLMEEPW
jgi:hypothetical protein